MKLLDELSIRYKIQERKFDDGRDLYTLEFFLYEDNPRFSLMRAELEAFYLVPQIGTVFDKEDLEKANWFRIAVGDYQYPQPEIESGYLKASFNLDHFCPHCGVGKLQNAPFRLKTKPKQLNNQFWGLHWEHDAIFVRSHARNILESEGVTGMSFTTPVLDKKGIEVDDLWQIQLHDELQPGLDDYNLTKEICEYKEEPSMADTGALRLDDHCGRTRYNFPLRGGLTFKAECFSNAPDFVKSREWFGSSGLAMQLPIVSKRVKQLIENHTLRGMTFEPIFHERFE